METWETINKNKLRIYMETEERFSLMEKRLNMIEDEIEKVQKDIQLLGENCKIEVIVNDQTGDIEMWRTRVVVADEELEDEFLEIRR